MKLHTTTSWDEMLLRVMQSWADSAWGMPREFGQACNASLSCERSSLVRLAEECDQTVEVWPHWMRCNLNWLLHDLKSAVQDQARYRVHHRGLVLDYFYGSGSTYSEHRSAAVREAMEIMDLNTKMFYIWIENELLDLGGWPRKVYLRMEYSEDDDHDE